MATTTFFEKVISDREDKRVKVALEFGRSSYYGDNLIYFKIDETSLIVDAKTGKEICDAMANLATYLRYDET